MKAAFPGFLADGDPSLLQELLRDIVQTTLRINDETYRRAKAKSGEMGLSLTRFFRGSGRRATFKTGRAAGITD